VIVEHKSFESSQRRFNGLDLPHDIYAIAVILYHLRNAAHLALNTGQSF